ncbi:hypothetical protein cyc_00017 [Cyclospora cayetanensis]|uniref:Uncharacterized protein n=1 Tax=Cyclospora cayetanensis TaxID=88456 RepID=A0A1D3CSC1_9EIME|nr:hypothetical protein cyc_00017 [Cyclospora cayetanensis]
MLLSCFCLFELPEIVLCFEGGAPLGLAGALRQRAGYVVLDCGQAWLWVMFEHWQARDAHLVLECVCVLASCEDWIQGMPAWALAYASEWRICMLVEGE